MIRLDKSLIDGLDPANPSLPAVQKALQKAVELEHATIPTYLYALYSLVPGKNDAIAAIIESVVVEEMLHMTLACNVLNAVGGAPQIDRPDFIPTYPGPLPGGVQSGLTVQLAPFSMDQLGKFLEIEEPEDPLVYKSLAIAEAQDITIGMFYTAISDCIAALGENVFVDPPRHQVGPDLMFEAVVVTDVATAQQAINTIIEQGEGTGTSPEEVVGGGYAHYYRFQQIAMGHELVKNPDPQPNPDNQYSFTGPAIPFDDTGVYAVPTDPSKANYTGQQRFENETFNYTYTSLLKSLHGLFNGADTQAQFNRAIGLMMSLKGQARAIMAGLPNPDPSAPDFVGPSFEYQPLNPGPPS